MTPSERLTLQPVTQGDEATLLSLARAFHEEDGHPLTAAGERAIAMVCGGDPMAMAWFLRADGVQVGYAVLTLGFSIEHGGRDGFIDDLYLVPAARGRGVGRIALALIERIAAEHGVRTLHLEVERTNTQAEGLYRRLGYRETDRRLMSKKLTR